MTWWTVFWIVAGLLLSLAVQVAWALRPLHWDRHNRQQIEAVRQYAQEILEEMESNARRRE